MGVTAPAVPASGTATANPTGQNVAVNVTGGTGTAAFVTAPNPLPVTTPAVPASTVTATNSNAFPVLVVLSGFTATVVSVNGTTVGSTNGSFVVPAGGTIAVTYTVAGTWTWSALVAGFSQASGAFATNLPVPPGCSITLLYSAAPSWTWTDPIDLDYVPGYYASNTQAEAAGWNPYTALPYPQHAALAQPGLATGVSN